MGFVLVVQLAPSRCRSGKFGFCRELLVLKGLNVWRSMHSLRLVLVCLMFKLGLDGFSDLRGLFLLLSL